MVAIIYIFNLLGPIVSVVGFIGMIALINGEMDEWLWIVSGITGFIGIFFGISAWSYGVPPRWFWAKSPLFLFENTVGCCFTHMLRFFFLPMAIALAVEVFG